jgi:hypothetical protein
MMSFEIAFASIEICSGSNCGDEISSDFATLLNK